MINDHATIKEIVEDVDLRFKETKP